MRSLKIATISGRSERSGTTLSPGNSLAEIVGEFVSKGSKLYIEGKVRTSCWEDAQSGERKYRTEIIAREIVLLDSWGSTSQERWQESDKQGNSHNTGSSPIADDEIPF
jgi:single-strand DNA-binding protein